VPVRPLTARRRTPGTGLVRRAGASVLTAALLATAAATGAGSAGAAPVVATPAPVTADPAVLAASESPTVVTGPGVRQSAAAQRSAGQRLLAGAAGWKPAPTRGVPTPRSAVPLPRALDAQPSYVPQNTCQDVAQPGLVRLRTLLERTYPGTGSYGINISCLGRSGLSEHLEGRAFDWKVALADPAQRAQAETFLYWVTASDGAMARRLGIMYVIWNGRIWGAYSPQAGWRAQSCSGTTACHRDHVHISMTWDGAYARTSFWTGRPVTVADVGPCVNQGQFFAVPYRPAVRRTVPCPAWKPLTPGDGTFPALRRNAGRTVSLRETGEAVFVAIRILGGERWMANRSTALTGQELAAFQYRRGIPVTGTITPATWQQLASFTSAGAVRLP